MKKLRKYASYAVVLFATAAAAQTPADIGGAAARAEALVEQAREDERHVLYLQALARKEKDVIKLTCINDKLVQLKAQHNLLEMARLQGDGAELSPGSLAEMEERANSIKKLRGEADGCAGELDVYKQESRSDFTRPDLDDATRERIFENPDGTGIESPAYATPFK